VQPEEGLMIAGAGVGAFILGNGLKTIKATIKLLPTLFKGSRYTKDVYMELMALLYVLLAKARKEGTLTLEADIDDPEKSPIFTQYPKILADHHIVEFLTDYLRLMVGGNMNAFEIESLMDEEIETHHAEGEGPAHALSRVGDAMPAFGIVAAVMGVVHTMASADKPPAVLGAMIAQALVGTFLGILLSYGLIGPLASLAEQRVAESTKMFQCIKVTILASLNGYAPAIAVEFGRKVLFSPERPSFAELEEHVRRVKAK
jgi:chemotaxis protein MotA